MAELFFLDKNLKFASAPVEDYTSLTWSPAWLDKGSFSVIGSRELWNIVRQGAEFVWLQGRQEIGIIENIAYSGGTCTVSGPFAESMIGWRILLEERHFKGIAGNEVIAALQDNIRGLPLIQKFENSGYSVSVETVQERGTPLDEAFQSILRPLGMSYAVKYSGGRELTFSIVRGKDRTREQTDNSWAIFSESFENISRCTYERNRNNYRNAATAYAEYNGTVVHETVDRSGNEMMREGAFWAEIDPEEMTESEFRTVLYQRAVEFLEEFSGEEEITGEAEGESLVPGKDYDIGDMVEVVMEDIGYSQTVRVTGIDIVVERGKERYIPKFGQEQVGIKTLIRREMKRI